MNENIVSKLFNSKYTSLLEDIINRNGLVSKENIDNFCEVFGTNISLKVVYPFRTFEIPINTILNMRDNDYKTNLCKHVIGFESISQILLKEDDCENLKRQLIKECEKRLKNG